MPSRRTFVQQSLLDTAAALTPTRDAIGAVPAGGYGYNHSHNFVIARDRTVQMNTTPLTNDWCWLTL